MVIFDSISFFECLEKDMILKGLLGQKRCFDVFFMMDRCTW